MKALWAVGVDGGGTKTAALATPVGLGSIIRRAQAGPCSISAMAAEPAAENIITCIDSLQIPKGDIGSICVGVAGFSAVNKRQTFIDIISRRFPEVSIEIVSDFLVAHTGALSDGVGIIIIAGTGSIAYGVNPIGESVITGGWGYIIDDIGSGYGLGRQVLVAFGKTLDGIAGCERLSELFTEKTGVTTREDLIASVYGGSLDRVTIASLSSLVTAAAASGDPYALSLLMHSGGALARVVQSAIARLFKPDDEVIVSRAGGLWLTGGELISVFERSIRRSCANVRFIEPLSSPVEGALKRSLLSLGHLAEQIDA
jgi:N-acetylglucosamine kinase-like BadF-type ATPase